MSRRREIAEGLAFAQGLRRNIKRRERKEHIPLAGWRPKGRRKLPWLAYIRRHSERSCRRSRTKLLTRRLCSAYRGRRAETGGLAIRPRLSDGGRIRSVPQACGSTCRIPKFNTYRLIASGCFYPPIANQPPCCYGRKWLFTTRQEATLPGDENLSMIELTVEIVSAYLQNNPVPVSDLPDLIASVNNPPGGRAGTGGR